MKKTIIALGLLTVSAGTTAGVMNDNVKMKVIPSSDGAWVTLQQGGEPISNATVTLSGALGDYVTPENGIVFVRTSEPYSRFETFTATLSDGEEITKRVMIPRDHRD